VTPERKENGTVSNPCLERTVMAARAEEPQIHSTAMVAAADAPGVAQLPDRLTRRPRGAVR